MIAYNDRFGARYCCLKQDVSPKCTYVIDEAGYHMLKDNFSDIYDIYTLRIYRRPSLITVDEERKARDDGNFNTSIYDFDYAILNNATLEEFESKLDQIVDKVFTFSYEEVFGVL
jgi:hypothetical protein